MKIKKKNFIISVLLCLILSIFIIITIIFFNNKEIINNLIDKNYKLGLDENTTILNLESKENDNVLLVFENNSGIKQITAPNGLTIFANGKKKVAMDYKVEENEKYTFNITDINNNVTYKSFICPKAHIEITRQDFDIDMEDTMSKLIQNFYDNMIATNFINIDMGELNYMNSNQSVNLQEAVSTWKVIGADTWRVTSDGKIYSSVPGGSSKPNWWGTGLINPDEKVKQTYNFEMDFTLFQSGQLNEGPCFFVSINSDGSLNGYFFNVNNHKACYGNPNYYQCRLWRFDHYTLDQSFSGGINNNTHMWCYPVSAGWNVGGSSSYGNDKFTCLAAWNGSLNATYHVEASDGHILITMNGSPVANVIDNTYTSGTYGFWGNNCEQKDSMYLTNINFKSMNIYTLSNLLSDTTWAPITINAVVNFSNEIETSMSDLNVINTFKDNEIHYLQIGSETNKTSSETFIANIDNRGKWIDSSNYDNYINQIETYLVNLFK